MERRSLLARLATAGGAAALAGCSSLLGGSDGSDRNDGNGTSDADGTPTLTAVPVTATDGESGGAGDGVVTATPTPTPTPEPRDYDGWLADVEPYAGRPVDYRGFGTVTVQVGAEGNGGQFAFAPAAVLVDTGTTVRWKWTGEGGAHNVDAVNGTFGSEVRAEARSTFEVEFGDPGVYRYACEPHEALGARGVVEVV